jgi:hypothetical protein
MPLKHPIRLRQQAQDSHNRNLSIPKIMSRYFWQSKSAEKFWKIDSPQRKAEKTG